MAHCLVRRRQLHVRAIHLRHPRVGALSAEHEPRSLGTPRAEQSRKAHYLPGPYFEIDGIHQPAPAYAAHRQERLLAIVLVHCFRRAFLEPLAHPFAARHLRNQHFDGQVAGQILALTLAVAHHGNAIGDSIGLLEKVRDEQYRHPRRLESPQDRKQSRNLAVVEARCRLIENQHARVDRDCSRDRDHLLHGDRIGIERARDVDGKIQVRKHLACARMDGFPVDRAALHRLPADKDVLRYRQVRAQVHFLIDRLDSRRFRVERSREAHGLPAQPDLASIMSEHARQHVDERRFARAVLAHQRMDLAGKEPEIHLLQRLHARERLVDAGHFEDRC